MTVDIIPSTSLDTTPLACGILSAATEQGLAGSVVAKAAPAVYFSGGVAGSTAKGSTGGRVSVAFGL